VFSDSYALGDTRGKAARFSEVIRAVANEGPQIITWHGEDVAVIVDIVVTRNGGDFERAGVQVLHPFAG
jgi:antitoxin (DNA-binding transcriptional repressor) of toxin-antitoxin stability system